MQVCDDGTFWGCFESPCVLHEIECAAAKYVKIHSSHEVTVSTRGSMQDTYKHCSYVYM